MSTRTEKFERKSKIDAQTDSNHEEEVVRFSVEEETELLSESNEHKTEANKLFAAASFDTAISTYDKALLVCPNYLNYEIAVLKSNVAACYLKLEDWKEAVKASTAALDGLEKLEKNGLTQNTKEETVDEIEEADEEINIAGPRGAEIRGAGATRKDDIDRIRAKSLMRRARAKSELGGWSNLQGAEEDYKVLSTMNNLSAADRKVVQNQLLLLPPRTKAAQEKEMGEMMGKLKQLGNGILKPFGLSTDNFQMVKDEKTGGYSMNFNQGGN